MGYLNENPSLIKEIKERLGLSFDVEAELWKAANLGDLQDLMIRCLPVFISNLPKSRSINFYSSKEEYLPDLDITSTWWLELMPSFCILIYYGWICTHLLAFRLISCLSDGQTGRVNQEMDTITDSIQVLGNCHSLWISGDILVSMKRGGDQHKRFQKWMNINLPSQNQHCQIQGWWTCSLSISLLLFKSLLFFHLYSFLSLDLVKGNNMMSQVGHICHCHCHNVMWHISRMMSYIIWYDNSYIHDSQYLEQARYKVYIDYVLEVYRVGSL